MSEEISDNDDMHQGEVKMEVTMINNNSTVIDFNSTPRKLNLITSTPIKIQKSEAKNKSKTKHLWIYNINPSTHARELKECLSKYGNVLHAKIVKNGNNYYGFSVMQSSTGVEACIENLNKTIFKDYKIVVSSKAPNDLKIAKVPNKKIATSKSSKLNHSDIHSRMSKYIEGMRGLQRQYEHRKKESTVDREKLMAEKRRLKKGWITLRMKMKEIEELQKKAEGRGDLANNEEKAEFEELKRKSLEDEKERLRLEEELRKKSLEVEGLNSKILKDEKDRLGLLKKMEKESTEVQVLKRKLNEEKEKCNKLTAELKKVKLEVGDLRKKFTQEEGARNKLKSEQRALEKKREEFEKLRKRNHGMNIWQNNYPPRNYNSYNYQQSGYNGYTRF